MPATKAIKVSGSIFTAGGNAKTVKGQKEGVLTAICYLAPADTIAQLAVTDPERLVSIARKVEALQPRVATVEARKAFLHACSTINTCPFASEGCKAACLFTAGHGSYSNVADGRIRRTLLFTFRRDVFTQLVTADLARIKRRADKEGMTMAIRCDGTSDILTRWFLNSELASEYSDVHVYTYTKRPLVSYRELLAKHVNFHVTYSLHEGSRSINQAMEYLAAGYGVAAVFGTKQLVSKVVASGYLGFPVIDGDETDARHLDPKGCIVALAAKGKAKRDSTGFVIRSLT